jgi:hypothetical protein
MVWYAPVNIYRETKNFLIDTGAARSVMDWQVFQALQCPLPKVSQTKMRFVAANGIELKCHGIAHFPLTFMGVKGEYKRSIPLYLCDLGGATTCILGMDAAVNLEWQVDCAKGILYFGDGNRLNCLAGRSTRLDTYQARALESVIIKPHSFAGVPIGTRQKPVPHEWRHDVFCE